jgi:hypothetical protein
METVVASALLLVVLTIVVSVLVSFQRTFNTVASRDNVYDQAHLAIEQLGSQITSGNVLQGPTNAGFSLVIFTQTNGVWDCVQWKVASNTLESRSWTQGYPDDGSSPTSWRTVATDIVNTSTEAPFVRPSVFNNRLINIDLYLNQATSSANPEQVQTSVEGRDTEYGYPVSACTQTVPG